MNKEHCLSFLLDFVFYLFLVSTILIVLFTIFVPTSNEWPGEFPKGIIENGTTIEDFFSPFVRHLALFPEHFPIAKFIQIINGVFLTIFIYNIGNTVKEAYLPKDKKEKKPIGVSTYIDWALGALVSGIIFASSQALSDFSSSEKKIFALASIVLFACTSYFVLSKLKAKLEQSSDSKKSKTDEEDF